MRYSYDANNQISLGGASLELWKAHPPALLYLYPYDTRSDHKQKRRYNVAELNVLVLDLGARPFTASILQNDELEDWYRVKKAVGREGSGPLILRWRRSFVL